MRRTFFRWKVIGSIGTAGLIFLYTRDADDDDNAEDARRRRYARSLRADEKDFIGIGARTASLRRGGKMCAAAGGKLRSVDVHWDLCVFSSAYAPIAKGSFLIGGSRGDGRFPLRTVAA